MEKKPSKWFTYKGHHYEFEYLIKGLNKGKFRTVVHTGSGCSSIVSYNTKSHKKAKDLIDTRILLS